MKFKAAILAMTGFTLASSLVQAQTPGSISAVAGQVTGTVSVARSTLGGCPTRICTTNFVTEERCFTNTFQTIVCTTNPAGMVSCTNVPVTVVRCFTNTFPEISCTNEFLTPPTSLRVEEALSGALTEGACNELSALIPSNAVFQASIALNVRTNDWVGTQIGAFRITVDGTNILVIGSLSGVTGLSTPLPDNGTCAVCNGFQGTLHGTVVAPGPLHGAQIQAAYRGVLSGVTCPSANVPQGAVQLVFDGVAIVPCPATISPFSAF